jgi:PAS domain S-box-containing protein
MAGFILLYFVVARLSLWTLGDEGIAVVWPAAGLSLALLLLYDLRLWVGIIVAVGAANLQAGFTPPLAMGLALANALETLLAAMLLRDVVRLHPGFARFRDIFGLGLVSLVAMVPGALLAALTFALFAPGRTEPVQVALTWWRADQVSIWLITPAVMTLLSSAGLKRRSPAEWLLLGGSWLLLGALAFQMFWYPFRYNLFSMPFIVFPLLVWMALRFDPFATAMGNLLLGTFALWGSLRGTGPFNIQGVDSRTSIQVFLVAAPFTSLVLAVVTEERRRNAARARHNEEWLRATLRAARAAILEWDSRSDRLTRSAEHDALFGVAPTAGDWARQDLLGHLHPEERERVADTLEQCLRENAPCELEFRVLWPDASTHWLLYRATPRLSREGRPMGVAGVALDVTERKLQEQALAESERRFRRVADTAPVLLWMADPDGGCTYLNRAWLAFTGRSVESQLGAGWRQAMHPDDQARHHEVASEAARARRPYELEYRLRHHDGAWHWILDHAAPRFAGDTFLGYIGACVDIQHLKEVEALLQERSRSLARTNQELASSNADLEQFAYVTSHDLREPIRMVLSYGELLERRYGDKLDERGLKYLRYIVEGALRLQELVSDLLAYSRAGRGDQIPVGTPLDQVLQRVQLALNRPIAESHARLHLEPLPMVQAFPSQMELLFQNLLENALKFRSAEPPEVTVSARDVPEGWEVQVCDNGIGIQPQYLQRIFGLFQRLHSREEYPGTGMGLAICKRIVERHGGRIWATSQPGVGTCIHILLPRRVPGADFRGEPSHDEPDRGAARRGQPGGRRPDAGGALGEQAAGEPAGGG